MAIRLIAPIQNFSCAKNRVKLRENTFLLKYSDTEIREIESLLKKRAQQLYVNEVLDQARNYFVIESTKHVKNIPQFMEPIWLFFESVLNALRIFKKGDIWFTNVYGLEHAGKGEVFPPTKYHTIHDRDKLTFYQLNLNETIAFTNFWDKFGEAIKKTFIDRAVRRFGQAIGRQKLDDKLLDYMISFECLFSTGQGESRHKISRRTAVLLEEGDEADKTAQQMKAFYDSRSDIVHGRDIKYEAIDKQVELIENYLRRSLKTIIQEKRFNRDHLNKYVDFYCKKSGS